MGARSERRNRGIDVLRGLAILMVLLLHFSITYDAWDNGPLPALVGPVWASSILRWGNYGVTVFFVISGFLITSNTLERFGSARAIDVRAFYVRRFARIFPPLLLAVSIIVILGLLRVPSFIPDGAQPVTNLLLGAVSVLGFFHNILMQRLGYFDYALNIYWSLSVEEVFYLLFPIVCVTLRSDTLVGVACLVFIVAGPLYRASHSSNEIYYLYANLACFDAISFGCLTALLARRWRPSRLAAARFRAGGYLALASVWLQGFGGSHKVLGFTTISFSAAMIIIGSLENAAARRLTSLSARPLRWLGRHSYELYLFHIIIFRAHARSCPGNMPRAVLADSVAADVSRSLGNRCSSGRQIRGRSRKQMAATTREFRAPAYALARGQNKTQKTFISRSLTYRIR
jgi:peptidoglycan/LPS O-acetylase OafA/YrhL